jgi:hypothetical protein
MIVAADGTATGSHWPPAGRSGWPLTDAGRLAAGTLLGGLLDAGFGMLASADTAVADCQPINSMSPLVVP